MRQLTWCLIFICAFVVVGCNRGKQSGRTGPQRADVDFAREAFKLLADGDLAAAEMIDWEHLNVAGMDAGASYRPITTDGGREAFHRSFITSYSSSFKSSGGNVDVLSKWREQSKDGDKTVVAADAPNGNTILITVSHANGQQKISALALKQ